MTITGCNLRISGCYFIFRLCIFIFPVNKMLIIPVLYCLSEYASIFP